MADTRRQSGLWSENPSTGTYEQQSQPGPYQYYQPPTRKPGSEKRRSYSERAGDNGVGEAETYRPTQPNGVQRSESRKVRDLRNDRDAEMERQGYSTSNSDARAGAQPLRVDPNAVPDNLRDKPWSPDLVSPRTGGQQKTGRQASTASNASELLRRGSVPDRSPLQKLEMEFSNKTEKRAKLEEAERRLSVKDRSGRDDRRIVSDGAATTTRRPNEGVRRDEKPVRVSADVSRDGEGVNGSKKFHRASDALKREVEPEGRRSMQESARQRGAEEDVRTGNNDLGRSGSKYKHRARDAGFAGAAAAMAGAGVAEGTSAAERGKAAHERRKGGLTREGSVQESSSPSYAREPEPMTAVALGRSGSRKLQKRNQPADVEWYGRGNGNDGRVSQDQQRGGQDTGHATRQALQSDRIGGLNGTKNAGKYQEPDPLPPAQVATGKGHAVPYSVPPQTAAGRDMREQVGFGASQEHNAGNGPHQEKHHHSFGGVFHHHDAPRGYEAPSRELDEWRSAGVARVRLEDFAEGRPGAAISAGDEDKNSPWWEKEREQKGGPSSSSGSTRNAAPPQMDGPYEEEAKHFRPPLYLKCGPLLRYTGMRRENAAPPSRSGSRTTNGNTGDKEIWRGSIMIVTDDRQSDYSSVPTLRLFAQEMELHTPPPKELLESGHELPPEYEDPVAGQVKLSRTGRPLYVRHVHEIDGEVDLSREENPQGLFAATRTPALGPQNSMENGRESRHITFQDKSRVKKNRAEKEGRYREVRAHRLHVERGYTFWRFNIEIELGSRQHRVAYRINKGPAIGFWVPAKGETMHTMFHSCNGFSMSVDPHLFSGPDPLWRDVMNRHQMRPFHVMLGGGDQIYNDAVMRDTELFKEWLQMKNPEHKHSAPFTHEMQEELESFYLERYCMWFSQGLFGMANAQIPMVNLWDDHDIIDGFGSYPHHFMASPVFAGVGAVAFKFYMLFQHQSLVTETQKEEPSWILGHSPGPYISQLSRSVYVRLGKRVGFLGLDCRTERMRDEILSQETYDVVFDRLRHELRTGGEEVRHLIVLLSVPIAYPRLNFLENILTSRVMDPIKALGRAGMLGGFVNKFDGGVEILDDLDDHWTAKHHKAERNWFISELQELSREFEVRITILGGDVHLGAVGQFYSGRKATGGLRKDRDWRYMPNIISSAIVNTPPPNMMADVLNKRNRVHKLDKEGLTEESMIPLFEKDVDGSKRNNRCLLPRRNYCTIREYVPGSTPPHSPRLGPHNVSMDGQSAEGMMSPREGRFGGDGEGRRFPPGSMKRTMSLTRGPAALVRRLSGSGKKDQRPGSAGYGQQEVEPRGPMQMQRANSLGGEAQGSYFPPHPADDEAEGGRPINRFLRRPTNLSIKEARTAAAKGGAEDDDNDDIGKIDLEGGLDISLCMEVDQKHPTGETIGYRLLVPALWCEDQPVHHADGQGVGHAGDGIEDEKFNEKPKRGGGLLRRLTGRGKRGHEVGEDGMSRSPSPTPPPSRGGGGMMGGQGFQQQSNAMGHGMHSDGYETQPAPPRSREADAYQKGYTLSSPPIGSTQPQRFNAVSSNNNPYPQYAQGGGNTNPGTRPKYQGQLPHQQQQVRGGAVPRHAANEPWRDGQQDYNEYSEGSLTPSDEYINPNEKFGAAGGRHGPAMQGRRPSKAERFFGIGAESGPWGRGGGGGGGRVQKDEGGYGDHGEFDDGEGYEDDGFEGEPQKRKASWKIWQK
ncbi:hypothetical protein LTR78_004377 [Recurvomyces mirabilis]|uniref:PhoD-like phosphatase domain-containing protein n=1 Tax=Recurvomyces mirabilis TaxID=574656 RepID=A0AAE0WQ71_9PEZI|nr:hypothetical protein LTR78_004377 [Recurvomyces mirabilis]KAK5155957.1 hypothetical protein LTS14_005523 [Recurvomyces mirabilis]